MGFSYAWRQEFPIISGIALGIAGCFKPHVAGALLLFLFVKKCWRPVLISVATGSVSVAVFALRIVPVSWWSTFMGRTTNVGFAGGPDDFSLSNSARYELVNLQVLFATFTKDRILANTMAIGIVLVLVVGWLYLTARTKIDPLLSFATISTILLLPSYHRFYDAGVIIFIVIYAASKESFQWCTLLLVPFMAPIPAALVYLKELGRLPANLFTNKIFIALVMCHEVWILLILSVLMLLTMSRQGRWAPHESNSISM